MKLFVSVKYQGESDVVEYYYIFLDVYLKLVCLDLNELVRNDIVNFVIVGGLINCYILKKVFFFYRYDFDFDVFINYLVDFLDDFDQFENFEVFVFRCCVVMVVILNEFLGVMLISEEQMFLIEEWVLLGFSLMKF